MSVCTKCGENIQNGAQACPACGAPTPAPAPAWQQPAYPPQQAYQPPMVPAGEVPPAPGSPYSVISTIGYVGLGILFALPVIGVIACLIMAFAAKNLNCRNYARAGLIFMLVGLAMIIITFLLGLWLGDTLSTLLYTLANTV